MILLRISPGNEKNDSFEGSAAMVFGQMDDGKSSKGVDGRCDNIALLVWSILCLGYLNFVVVTSML